MEKNRFPTDREEIEKICERYRITNYTLNSDGSIDVDGNVYLDDKNLDKLPLKFSKVWGDFVCYDNQLTSLEGCPRVVGGNFWCNNNQLTTLEGCPKEVGVGFYCHNNKLTTLEGCLNKVDRGFDCSFNKLKTLEGCPKEVGYFDCSNNQLETLEGAPKEVEDYFNCSVNELKSLEGIPITKGYDLYGTPFSWVSDELKDLLLYGLKFGLTADECLCLSDRSPDRRKMINNLESEKKKLIGVLSILYELKK